MRQFYQQPEPPRKSFMEQSGWQLIIIGASLLAGIIGTVIVGIWQGTTHVIDFNWIVLGLMLITFVIVAFFVWYIFRTRQRLQEQYQEDLATLKREYQNAQNNFRDMTMQEFNRLNEGFINYSQENAKQQKEHSEKLESKCLEAIRDAEQRLDVTVKYAQSMFNDSIKTNGFIINHYNEQLIHEMRRMDAIEEHFKNKILPDDQEQST